MSLNIKKLVLAASIAMGVISAGTTAYASSFTITLNPGAGEMSSPKIIETDANGVIPALPEPTYPGSIKAGDRDFTGWYDTQWKENTQSGTKYNEGTKLNSNITLYAHYSNRSGSYTEGHTYRPDTSVIPEGWDLTGYTCIDDSYNGGYLFVANASTGGAVIPNAAYDDEKSTYAGSDMDVTLSQKFQGILPETVQKKLANVKIETESGPISRRIFALSKEDVSTYNLGKATSKPWWTRTANTAAGAYAVSSTGKIKATEVTNKQAGYRPAFVILNETANLVKFDAGKNAKATPLTLTVESGQKLGSLPTVNPKQFVADASSKINAVFASWNTKSDGTGNNVTTNTRPAGDTTYYAKWNQKSFDYLVTMINGKNKSYYGAMAGEKISSLPAPDANELDSDYIGAIFKGWYSAPTGGTSYYSTSPITGDMTVYAHWEKRSENGDLGGDTGYDPNSEDNNQTTTYKVTFDTNGGSNAPLVQTVKKGESAKKPEAPSKEGCIFDGWYLNGSQYDFTTPVTADITLKAKWNEDSNVTTSENNAIKTFKVSFDSEGGNYTPLAQIIQSGKTATKPENPTKKGYSFSGWYLNGSQYDFSSPVTANITLRADWTDDSNSTTSENTAVKTFTVSFDSAGGNYTPLTQKVQPGETAEKPENPTKKGFTFNGWYLNDSKYDFSSPVTANITLKADWIDDSNSTTSENTAVKTFTVSFDSAGGNYTPLTQKVQPGETVEKPVNPSKKGFTFNGWYLNDSQYDFSSPVTADITLKANWTDESSTTTSENTAVKTFTVYFDSAGGNYTPKAQKVQTGKTVTKPTDPTNDGHSIKGWYLNNTKWDFTKAVTSDMTLVAKYKTSYTVKFSSGFDKKISSQTIEEGGHAKKPDVTRSGYELKGWYLVNSNKKVSNKIWDFDKNEITSNTHLKAVWTAIDSSETQSDASDSTTTDNESDSDDVNSSNIAENAVNSISNFISPETGDNNNLLFGASLILMGIMIITVLFRFAGKKAFRNDTKE